MFTQYIRIIDGMLPLKKWFVVESEYGYGWSGRKKYKIMICDYSHPSIDGITKFQHFDILFETFDYYEARDFVLEFLFQLQDITNFCNDKIETFKTL